MIAASLLAWFRKNARDLPWRDAPAGSRSPYRVWVSEVMLQQTRVETVLRYYGPFLAQFPTVESLAEADEDALMKAWEGLGYYRRVRLMHAGARRVVAAHAGHMPDTCQALRALPGFGPYTAGAVASIALGERAPAVDGNVLRVWSRVCARSDDVSKLAARAAAEAWVMAHQPAKAPGAFNEALMELGATVCTPKRPNCGACPVAAACIARAEGNPETFPAKARKAAPRPMRVSLAWVARGDKLLLEKRDSGLLAGTWGLPWVEGGVAEIGAKVAALTGGRARVGDVLARDRHVFTHRVWDMEMRGVTTSGRKGEWRAPESVALASAHRKILRAPRSVAPEAPK